jgi:hypothetical protein
MNRLKALYRGWGIACAGTQVYAERAREEWLSKIPQAGVRRRAELLYQQLDGLQALRRDVRPEFLAESRKHKAAIVRQLVLEFWALSFWFNLKWRIGILPEERQAVSQHYCTREVFANGTAPKSNAMPGRMEPNKTAVEK